MKRIKDYIINLSLKKKWMLSSAIAIFISYAVISIMIYFALYTWLIHYEENNALRIVDDLTALFNDEKHHTIQELQQNTGLLKSIVNQNQTVRIFNLDGYEVLRINDRSPAADITLSNAQSTTITKQHLDGQNVFVINRPLEIGSFVGYLQLIHPLITFDSMMYYVFIALMIAGIGALFIAISISHYLANYLVKPLHDLRDSMVSIRENGFYGKIQPTYKADDEIGDLITIYRTMIEELQKSFKRQQQFVSDASHELRTPIQSIEGHLSLIQRWGKDDPEVLNESLETSLVEVKRMKKLIEELLDLARNEERDSREKASISKVFQMVKEELQIIYKDCDIKFEEIGEVKYPSITENALAQIMRNIIENGIRYNQNIPKIDIKVNYFQDSIEMTIQDNGIGISEKDLPHIFDRFYRVDDSRKSGGGSGLGLSITKMLSEKYNIKIKVSSELGKGTIFSLIFSLK